MEQYRLKKNASFNYIYRKGKSISNKYMVLVYVKSYQTLKVGYSVSKKIGNSVTRNHTKRLFREAVRSLLPNMNQHTHYVFIARQAIVKIGYHEYVESIKELLQEASLYLES